MRARRSKLQDVAGADQRSPRQLSRQDVLRGLAAYLELADCVLRLRETDPIHVHLQLPSSQCFTFSRSLSPVVKTWHT